MPHLIQRQRPAMGTWFAVRLVGDDPEHLAAVAEAALDEVERIERLLSRFDPRSEIARINRDAGGRAVLVDREVLEILLICQAAWERTEGYFDVTAGQGTFAAVSLHPPARKVRFEQPGVALDLGGIGKGYALDRAAEILRAQGIGSAFLHGGTSSVLALGSDENGRPWTVAVRDPFAPAALAAELFRIDFVECGFSCSATRAAGQAVSDLVDPRTGAALAGRSACVAVARNATQAEVFSTALLCMGKVMAKEHGARYGKGELFHLAWIQSQKDRPVWDWLV
jgi:thiamine biosynthesis lipoprotein